MNINVIGAAANFKIGFADTTLTSHAGAVLMKDFISRLSVRETLDQEIDVKERLSAATAFPRAFSAWLSI